MVKISRNELAGALAALGKLVCRTSPVDLYKTIRLQTNDPGLCLTTTGMNESLSVVLDAESDGPLDKIVYFSELKDMVKGSSAGSVTFHEADGVFSIQVESGRNIIGRAFSEVKVDWPEPVKIPVDVKPVALPEGFVSKLATAAPIVDRNNPRKALQGVNLSRNGIAVTNGKELWVEQTYIETDPLTIPFPLALLATKEKQGGWLKVWRTPEEAEKTADDEALLHSVEDLLNDACAEKDLLIPSAKDQIRDELIRRFGLYYDKVMK